MREFVFARHSIGGSVMGHCFLFFFVFAFGCVMTNQCTGETVNGFLVTEVESCTKAYNKTLLGDHVERCVYICEGLPLRTAKEKNGTPCKDTYTEDGTCQDGNCVPTSS
ncbi:hypothetical protein IscW_ISCW004033 [Ixodes scapularis]|uniref:Uncharacterized protein n=1 Tax=Ixodes scapularis TaxID=6945 RepID=B7PFH0_IXOSC|nr:hypothetical protein IscW_ISCW004033 [Ixodes scapularis]|eukprot:XP_002433942.1 hypothetical protein IscW_ISCW004033 [Ixodes scapularis]